MGMEQINPAAIMADHFVRVVVLEGLKALIWAGVFAAVAYFVFGRD